MARTIGCSSIQFCQMTGCMFECAPSHATGCACHGMCAALAPACDWILPDLPLESNDRGPAASQHGPQSPGHPDLNTADSESVGMGTPGSLRYNPGPADALASKACW